MRNLRRNGRNIWYSLYEGKEPVLKDGFETGQYREVYSSPVAASVFVSPANGKSESELFGAALQYDCILSSTEDLPIDEYSRLWLNADPEHDAPDYRVKRTSKGLTQHLWAVERIVSRGD